MKHILHVQYYTNVTQKTCVYAKVHIMKHKDYLQGDHKYNRQFIIILN